MPAKVVYIKGSTLKICQLTGEVDRELGRDFPAFNTTEAQFGLRGTDLGASFEHKGRCYFLFGDTHPIGPNDPLRPFDGDSIAYTADTRVNGGVRLTFLTVPDGKYIAPSAPGVSMKGFEVPTGGFSADGRMYIFYTSDVRFKPEGAIMGRSVLLRSDDDGKTFRAVYTVSRDKIVYIAPIVVENAQWPGLPDKSGRGLLLFASSTQYRRSNPYLAYLPLNRVEDPKAVRYFAGTDAKTNQPNWSEKESDAVPLFVQPQIGELCVSYNRFIKRWLMLYNAGEPRGINFRSSETPWGAWSETALLFHPWDDGGYGKFMHISRKHPRTDALSDPGREDDWGGEYAPYLIDRYATGTANRTTLYFVMSTWNPYNVMLMKTTLELKP